MTLFDTQKTQSFNEVGEDTCELFGAIEQSFGVHLGDYDDLAGTSILELSKRIEGLAKYPVEESCLSLVAFNKLRPAFQTVINAPRHSVRPATRIEDLLPWQTRHLQWALLQSELGLEIPRLNLPFWLLILSLVLPVSILVCVRFFLGVHISGGMMAIGSFILTLLALRAAMLYPARTVPASIETVGDLAKAIVACNYNVFAAANGSSQERGMLPALRLLVAMQTGIGIEKIQPETRIPSDLNIY
jgi:hypothetical protein